jgi:hypothetical protein
MMLSRNTLLAVVSLALVACDPPSKPGGDDGDPSTGAKPLAFVSAVEARTPADRDVLINVSAFDDDEDPLSLVVDVPPTRGTATPEAAADPGSSPALTYTPNLGFAGRDTFTVRVSDGALESDEVVQVTIDVIGRSCAHVLNSGGAVGDGVYFVDLTPEDDVADEDAVYCDMSVDGGGWTLALKVAGDAQTFCFDNPIWVDNTLLNAASADETPAEAKLAPYLLTPATELMIEMDEIVDTEAPSKRLVMPLSPDAAELGLPLRELVALEATYDTMLTASDWQSALFPDDGGLYDGIEGINVMRDASSSARIGQLGAGDAALSSVGIGMRSGACVEGGIDLVTAGARLAPAGGQPIGVPVDARVSVRSRDFTFLPARRNCDEHGRAGAFLTGTYRIDTDGLGGESPQPAVCPFGDMRRLVSVKRDGAADDDACPAPFVDDEMGCIAPAHDNVVSLIVDAPLPFTRIAGRIEALARGDLEAFSVGVAASLDNTYVDGVSITVGDPRTHVFTLGVGSAGGAGACPCGAGVPAPAYVGEGMLCEDRPASGDVDSAATADEAFDLDNALFDDDARNAACNQSFVPNEFDITLPAPSTGPIEVRVMVDGDDPHEAILLQRLDISVR